MGFWNWIARKVAARIEIPVPGPAPQRISLEKAMETLLVTAVEANGKALEARSASDVAFLTAMADLKARTAAEVLGRRGGLERVRRMRERQRSNPNYCPVCPPRNDGQTTRAILKWHMAGHNGTRPGLPQGASNEQSTKAARAEGLDSTDMVRPAHEAASTVAKAEGNK